MGKHIRSFLAITLFLGAALSFLVYMGCSGGSGGSGAANPKGASYGKVGVLLTDAPTDLFDHIYITITEISLLPEGGEGNPVIVFTDNGGYMIDLLDLRDKDFLLTLNEEVPTGRYEKVRLKVSSIDAVGGPCGSMEIDLPSGKIDINPGGSFTVEKGQALYVKLDINADQSINLHPAGKSGKCVFRPVVFGRIISEYPPAPCPAIFNGSIKSLLDTNGDAVTDGFILQRDYPCLGDLKIGLTNNTLIYSDQGTFPGADALQAGQNVVIYGVITPEGTIQAQFVAIGDILIVEGIVKSLPTSEGLFTFTPDAGEELIGQVEVFLFNQSLIMTSCGDNTDIVEGAGAVIIGRYDTQGPLPLFRAIAVLLPPSPIEAE